MRTTTATERSNVGGLRYTHHSKFEVQDADGTYRDYTAYLNTDWFTGATIEESQDESTMRLNATLLRSTGTLSLSPFVAASLVNRNAGGSYATAIDAWRKWRLSVAVMPEGYPPNGSDWKEMCQGRIDRIDWTGDLIQITGRGEEAVLLDFWIATERQYGSVGGIAMETVIQSLWDNNLGSGVYTLYTPSSPSYLMNAWTQQKGNLFPASTEVAQKVGAVLRFRYDSANSFRPTLLIPNRTATPGSEVWTLGPWEYTAVNKVAIDKSGIRNFVKLRFVDPTLGTQTVISPWQAGSGTVSCTAGTATFSSSQAGIIKTTGSSTEIIVAGIAYTVTAFNGTTGATLLSQLATGGVPTFGASSFTLSDTLSGAGNTSSINAFGRNDLEIDLAYTTQVNSGTKAQGMADAIRSDTELPNLEQEIETPGFWFAQLYDYGKFEANGIHYDSPQYGGVTKIRHEIANGTIKSTLSIRGKPSGAYAVWRRLGERSSPSDAIGQKAARDTQPVSMRVTRVSETTDQLVVRVAAVTPNAGQSVSLAYDAGGLTVSPASPQTITSTADFATTGTKDFTITRDTQGGTPRRVTFTGSTPTYVDGTDGVDVPPNSTRMRSKVVITGSPSQTTGTTPTVISAWTESGFWDVGNLHDDVTNPSRLTVPTAGNNGGWLLHASVGFGFNATGDRFVAIYKNGTSVAVTCVRATSTSSNSTVISVFYADNAPAVGDYYEVFIWQNSGATLSYAGGTSETFFSAIHLW